MPPKWQAHEQKDQHKQELGKPCSFPFDEKWCYSRAFVSLVLNSIHGIAPQV
jgi:hypothetical protein